MTKPEAILSLEEIAGRLGRAGVAWAVFAGAAAAVYGATRPLTDIDILSHAETSWTGIRKPPTIDVGGSMFQEKGNGQSAQSCL